MESHPLSLNLRFSANKWVHITLTGELARSAQWCPACNSHSIISNIWSPLPSPLTPSQPHWPPHCILHVSGTLSSQDMSTDCFLWLNVLIHDISLVHSLTSFKYWCKSRLLNKTDLTSPFKWQSTPPFPPHTLPTLLISLCFNSHYHPPTFYIIYLFIRFIIYCLPCPHFSTPHFFKSVCSLLYPED